MYAYSTFSRALQFFSYTYLRSAEVRIFHIIEISPYCLHLFSKNMPAHLTK